MDPSFISKYLRSKNDFTEQFHSTPETQTDEAYNHPEDLEHFAQHEVIERQEAELEAKFQGISVEEVLKAQEGDDSENTPVEDASIPKVNRVIPPEKQDPSVRFKTAAEEGKEKGEWGSGPGGYKAPIAPGDRMRKNLPYKVHISSWSLGKDPTKLTFAI